MIIDDFTSYSVVNSDFSRGSALAGIIFFGFESINQKILQVNSSRLELIPVAPGLAQVLVLLLATQDELEFFLSPRDLRRPQ